MPGANRFVCGIETHSVLKRYLEGDNGKMRSLQNFFLLSYGLKDWLSIDLKGGIGDVTQQLNYPDYLGGGYGLRIKILDYARIKAVFGFQHISIHPHTLNDAGRKNKVVLDDWQLSALASYDFPVVTAYIGTRWSRMDCIHWVDGVRNRKKSDSSRSIGLILGTSISLTDMVWLNIEGNLFDSQAVSGSLNFRF